MNPLTLRLRADGTLDVFGPGEHVRLSGADRQAAIVEIVRTALDDDDVCDALSDVVHQLAADIINEQEEYR